MNLGGQVQVNMSQSELTAQVDGPKIQKWAILRTETERSFRMRERGPKKSNLR